METSYYPILKWKQGERRAMQSLPADVKQAICPVIEVIPPVDLANTGFISRTNDLAASIQRDWGSGRALIDLGMIDDYELIQDADDDTVLGALFGHLRECECAVVPVTHLARTPEFQHELARHIAADDRGVCIRIPEQHMLLEELPDLLVSALRDLGLGPSQVDLLFDWGALASGSEQTAAGVARSAIAHLPDLDRWRNIVFGAGGFPANMAGFAPGAHFLPRTDWQAWRLLAASRGLRRKPGFSDYAIAHPDLADVDPRIMQPSAHVRYTVAEDWLVLRGRSLKLHGYEQFPALCSELVQRSDFHGANYSAGDQQIAACAAGQTGTGNLTTWRFVGTSQHVTFVARQIATLRAL